MNHGMRGFFNEFSVVVGGDKVGNGLTILGVQDSGIPRIVGADQNEHLMEGNGRPWKAME